MPEDTLSAPLSHPDLLDLTTRIVCAHVATTAIAVEAFPELIQSVYAALSSAATDKPRADRQPAVPIRKSVFATHLVCLEEGHNLKVLKRHLRIVHGLTPAEYRQRWGLPDSYPMVAPDYAARRVALAKELGLGRRAARADKTLPPPIQRIPEGRRGRKSNRLKTTS